jgi:hypothetical protein
MSNYAQSLALLGKLIARLEANTGGEPLLPSESAVLSGAPSLQQTQPLPTIVEPIKEAQEPSEKKEPAKKAKGEGKKPAAKAEP